MADKKMIRRMEIEPAENGGHMVTHHFKEMPTHSGKIGMGMAYQEPEKHVFGENEGHAMLAHIANHLAIPESMGEKKEEMAPEKESAEETGGYDADEGDE
jgi:hypothetical protein